MVKLMQRARLSFVLIFLSLTLAAQTPTGLRKLLDDQTAAWNRGDLEAFMQGYWGSPDVTFFSGDTIVKGWEPTLQRYRDRYQSAGKEMGKLSFSDEKVEMLSRDAAMVTARWHLEMSDGRNSKD